MIGPIERLESYDRTYIPLPGGWEVQTKGKGSTFRIVGPGAPGGRMPIPDSPYLHETLERMARDVHAAHAAEVERLRAELAECKDKAIQFDLDRLGIESRSREAVELVELLELRAECAPFLKDGETPAECIARWRAEAVAILELLRQERVRSEKAEAELAARDASKPKEPKS